MGSNTEFEFKGINHLALVSSDMARTVDFYTNVLGMPLIKTLEIPAARSTSSSTAGTATRWRSSGSRTPRRPRRGSPRPARCPVTAASCPPTAR